MAFYGLHTMGFGGAGRQQGGYSTGVGTFEREPLVYRNELGQKVVMGAGVLRNKDGTLHDAYKMMPGTRIGDLISKQKKGLQLTPDEQKEVNSFWLNSDLSGLSSI